jgi:hypothetical protein
MMGTFFKLLVLVIILNVVRYVLGFPIEAWLFFDGMGVAMERSAAYFNSSFTTFDWVTSYFYNFAMWFVCAWIFHIAHPVMTGHDIVKSLKIFGIPLPFFRQCQRDLYESLQPPEGFLLIQHCRRLGGLCFGWPCKRFVIQNFFQK